MENWVNAFLFVLFHFYPSVTRKQRWPWASAAGGCCPPGRG